MVKDVVNTVNRKYVYISNRLTPQYERTFGLPCDVYFPVYPPHTDLTKYRDMKIFAPHQSPSYSDNPDVSTYFYIPFLVKKDAMNSSEAEFDAFYTEDEIDRPFIETTKKRELPISTKVVVHQGQSISKFFVDKKLVVTGADGMMLLRMYLSPLAKDNDEEEEFQEETTVEAEDYSPKNEEGDGGLGATLGSTESTTKKKAPSTKKKAASTKKKSTTKKVTTGENIEAPADNSPSGTSIKMNIPDED